MLTWRRELLTPEELMMTLAELSRKPLEQRQCECDERLRKELDPKIYESLKKCLALENLRWEILPMVLKRDLWELFWGVFRDTIEERAEKHLTFAEQPKQGGTIFG